MRLRKRFLALLGHLCIYTGILFMVTVTAYACFGVFITSTGYEIHFHNYGSWYTAMEGSCAKEGLEEQRCSCGATNQRTTDFGDHQLQPWQIKKTATRSMPGTRIRKCEHCDYTIQSPIQPISNNGELGSAGWIGNDTVIVSIFADDINSKWPATQSGNNRKKEALVNLKMATQWIQTQCAPYGVAPQFYYDWEEDPSLKYRLVFSTLDYGEIQGNKGYKRQAAQIEAFIDSEAIKQRYNARNIIYAFYFYEATNGRSYAYCDIGGKSIECINILSRSPRTVAHELLHCFGVPDLYSKNHMIPEEYIYYAKAFYPNDIMVCSASLENATLEEIVAYYLGLKVSHPHVEVWKLALSTHINKKYVKN